MGLNLANQAIDHLGYPNLFSPVRVIPQSQNASQTRPFRNRTRPSTLDVMDELVRSSDFFRPSTLDRRRLIMSGPHSVTTNQLFGVRPSDFFRPSAFRGHQHLSAVIRGYPHHKKFNIPSPPKITTPCYRFEKIVGQSRLRALTVFS